MDRHYDLDRLGWLQFEQLCATVLELEAGVPAAAWAGAADRCRSVLCERPISQPLAPRRMRAPVLVQCVWLRPDRRGEDLARALAAVPARREEDLAAARSWLVLTNASPSPVDLVRASLEHLPAGHPPATLAPPALIAARLEARPELRRTMPVVLGLRDLRGLIDPGLADRSTLDRDAAVALARVFVPTTAYRRALAALAAHSFAVLTGPPEMGKTAIARIVALAQLTDGWEAHECITPEAVLEALDPERSQVFVADDAFGSTEYRPEAAESWARGIEQILRALDARHWLIWTSRPAPLHAALRRLHRERGAERFPAPAEVLIDAGSLDVVEKTLILFRHAKAAELDPGMRHHLRRCGAEIVAHRHFTPERIRRLVARLPTLAEDDVAGAVAEELSRATEAMVTSFATLAPEHRDLLIAMLDTPRGPVAERDLVAALRRHHEGALPRQPAELVDRLSDHFLRVLA
jgi:Novel STAND NTPase 3